MGKNLLDYNELVSRLNDLAWGFLIGIFRNPDKIDDFKITESMFNSKQVLVWRVLKKMTATDKPIDLISINEELAADNGGPQIDLIIKITELMDSIAVNMMHYYHEKMLELWSSIQTYKALAKSQSELLSGNSPASVAAELNNRFARISRVSDTDTQLTIQDSIKTTIATIETRYNNQGAADLGVKTGLVGIDSYTCGMVPATYWIIGGRPSEGKTALALTIAANAAFNEKVPVGFISLEQNSEAMTMRLLSQRASVNLANIRHGYLDSKSGFAKLANAAEAMYDSTFYWHDEDSTLEQVEHQIRRMVLKFGCKIVFIDYVEMILGVDKFNSEREFFNAVSTMIARLKKQLNCCIVLLVQLARKQDNVPPKMKDLFGASKFEKDADVILLIHHANGLTSSDGDPEHKPDSRVIVDKNRDGERGVVPVEFQGQFVRYIDSNRWKNNAQR